MARATLLVSVPAAELASVQLPGAVFAWRDLRDALLPPDLRLALELVARSAAAERRRLRFLARPEIHTHGAARAWLDARIEGAREHLILTDGATLRALPGLDNHLFFYPRGNPGAEAALCRLIGIVPELFAGLAGQVNGSLAFRLGARWIRPKLRPLRFPTAPALEPPLLAPFLFHPANPAKAAALAAEAAVAPGAAPADDRPLHYLPLSEGALADAAFLGMLARRVQRAALGTEAELLVLGLPFAAAADAELADRLAAVLRALAGAGLPMPQGASWAVRFATAPPDAAELAFGRITLHPATPFWRLGADLFEAAAVDIAGGGALGPFRALLRAWLGQDAPLRRPVPAGPPVTIGFAP